MSLRSLLTPILNDDHVTRGLEDSEARMLIEWLVARVEVHYQHDRNERRLQGEVTRLCRRARAITRFVVLWCHEHSPSAALQLAATERFAWPLPISETDAGDLLGDILAWEDTLPAER